MINEDISLKNNKRKALASWLSTQEYGKSRLTFAALAEALGISPVTVHLRLGKRTIPVWQFDILTRRFGIPPEFLPEPCDLRPGRKPKH